MYGGYIVPEGYEYFVNGNMYHIQAIVPYSTYNYRVEVLFPIDVAIPIPKIEKPDVTLDDFNTYVQSVGYLVQDENDRLYPLVNLLIDIGQDIVDFDYLGNKNRYIQAVCYYVAHYMELHIKALKDEENRLSLNPSQASEQENKVEFNLGMGLFSTTLYGPLYWSIYGQFAKGLIIGVY